MINSIIAGISIALCLNIASPVTTDFRTCKGTYHDYLEIETQDGNVWLLSDDQAKINPYLKWNESCERHVPKFREGQNVTVKFYTKGTRTKLDDVIVWVR